MIETSTLYDQQSLIRLQEEYREKLKELHSLIASLYEELEILKKSKNKIYDV